MIHILPEHIPVLHTTGIIDGEAVAFGINSDGAIIHFIERDECILVEWAEIVVYGRELLNAMPLSIPDDETPTSDESGLIEKPTRRD